MSVSSRSMSCWSTSTRATRVVPQKNAYNYARRLLEGEDLTIVPPSLYKQVNIAISTLRQENLVLERHDLVDRATAVIREMNAQILPPPVKRRPNQAAATTPEKKAQISTQRIKTQESNYYSELPPDEYEKYSNIIDEMMETTGKVGDYSYDERGKLLFILRNRRQDAIANYQIEELERIDDLREQLHDPPISRVRSMEEKIMDLEAILENYHKRRNDIIEEQEIENEDFERKEEESLHALNEKFENDEAEILQKIPDVENMSDEEFTKYVQDRYKPTSTLINLRDDAKRFASGRKYDEANILYSQAEQRYLEEINREKERILKSAEAVRSHFQKEKEKLIEQHNLRYDRKKEMMEEKWAKTLKPIDLSINILEEQLALLRHKKMHTPSSP